jgi:hypothetical protein
MTDKNVTPHCRWAEIDGEGWVNPTESDRGTPIEDFGLYFLTDREVKPDVAFEVFLRLAAWSDTHAPGSPADLNLILREEEAKTEVPTSELSHKSKRSPSHRRPG